MSLETTRKGITEVLSLLRNGEWQIPQFQREFVWSPEQVKKLVHSFIKSYPIGLLTIWDQPQGNPHTPGEPIKLSGVEFKAFTDDPAVIKLVLDGRQRLTTIAMVFGGFHIKDDRYTYSGSWFIDIDAYSENREASVVVYKKQKEINKEGLNTLATCVQRALLPLKDFDKLGDYLMNVNNPDVYPVDAYPDEALRKQRSDVINALLSNFLNFQIPVAEIPKTVDLGAVCEIFDVLNTTGTKVSTFDLIHNLLFKESNGDFLIRDDKFVAYKDLNSFGRLCDDDRKEFLCQTVTGCYILEENPVKAYQKDAGKPEVISSIKGKDLIATPLSFYMEFDANVQKVDSYTSDLFSNIFGDSFELDQIPYPAQIILYLSLRWNLELRLKAQFYTLDELNRLYRAFFWRNTLTNRYDQGYLTQFTTDLRFIDTILKTRVPDRGPDWVMKLNEDLGNHFGPLFKARSKEEILEILRDGEIKGALSQGINLLISSQVKNDLLTGEVLDRFTKDTGKKVQLHHLFPVDWCKNNVGLHPDVAAPNQNNFANLIPLTAKSNNKWKANSPATAISSHGLKFESNVERFESGFINVDAYTALSKDDVEEFWKLRSERIAEKLYSLQFVA